MFIYQNVNNPNTKFFIFDTGRIEHRDIDFEIYTWNKHAYNIVEPGDVFIYRRPTKASENGKFYFFGAGQIKDIREVDLRDQNYKKEGDLEATISNPIIFEKFIYQDELHPSQLNDTRRQKSDSWEHFFNNYGMNQIPKEVFTFLLDSGMNGIEQDDAHPNDVRVELHQRVLRGNYKVSNTEATVQTRGKYQKIFRDQILLNYDFKCAITGIKTQSLLTAAHILRWADNENERLNPKNGICLSSLMDDCFEKGLITIDENYKVQLSDNVKKDNELYEHLKKYAGMRIRLPKYSDLRPSKEFLDMHARRFA